MRRRSATAPFQGAAGMRTPSSHHLLARFRAAIFSTQPECFSRRQGIMPPAVAMLVLLSLSCSQLRGGYETILISLFTTLGAQLGWKDGPAASTFCRARKKITPELFDALRCEIMRIAEPTLMRMAPRIRDQRVLAIDGSWIDVPKSRALKLLLGLHRFGPHRTAKKRPQVLLVVITNALTRMPIARVVLRGNGSERDGADQLMPYLEKDDILLADRGYPSRAFIGALVMTGCRFVVRMQSGKSAFSEVRGIQKRRVRDAYAKIKTPDQDLILRHVRASGGPGRPRRNSSRQTLFLLTNLTSTYSPRRIEAIYRHRWGIETMFRELKCTLQAEAIHAQSLEGVVQELDAMLLHLTMAAILEIAAVAEMFDHADLASWRRYHSVNRTSMLAIIASMLLSDGSDDASKRGAAAATRSAERAPRRRLGRFYPRKPKKFW
jgi:hypothetical protein